MNGNQNINAWLLTQNQWPEQITTEQNSNDGNTNNIPTCVVCYKNVEIYSIGMCEHPVCYECSTRMRVLCSQNECPICRQELPLIVFTKEIKPFGLLKKGDLVDTRYNVYFDSPSIEKKFVKLLAHVCSLCREKQVFGSFSSLKNHMRSKHELHYCDLCVENLKIFSFERRCYSRADLAQHRRKGDTDDKSHKGHPLCEFCDQRYMDNDELFRHLRRDHLYCHFCDADGLHQYYSSYDYLRDHFRQEHYLCEAADCAEEKFTCVFRTDIDLKAHRASVHGKHLGKAAAKQARTLELEFTLAPRGDNRSGGGRRNNGQTHGAAGPSNSRSYPNNDYGFGMNSRDNSESQSHNNYHTNDTESHCMRQPDVQSTEEFPSLSNSTPTIPNLNLSKSKGCGNLKICGSMKSQTLAVTDENFPALGPELLTNNVPQKTLNLSVYTTNKSSDLQRPQCVTPNVSIRVNRKSNGSITTRVTRPNLKLRPDQLSMDTEFPALGRVESSTTTANTSNPMSQWTKVTCVKPTASSKISNSKAKKIAPAPLLSSTPPASPTPTMSFTDAFPSLPKSIQSKKKLSISVASNVQPSTSLERPISGVSSVEPNGMHDSTKGASKKKKKKKVKPSSSGNSSNTNELTASKSDINIAEKNVQNDDQPSSHLTIGNLSSKKDNACTTNANITLADGGMKNYVESEQNTLDISNTANGNMNEHTQSVNDTQRKRSELKIDSLNRTTNCSNSIEVFPELDKSVLSARRSNPPPGFGTVAAAPPPGFAVKCNSMGLDNQDNGLTFTNSSGESFSILPDEHINLYSYVPPPDFQKRNKNLVAKISAALGSLEPIDEFRYFSGLFRQGLCSAEDYYKRCRSAIGIDAFADVFPEMLVLLPDIQKQRELYNLHKKEIGKNIKLLELCVTCGQVVQTGSDLKLHYSTHTLDNHFPTLYEAIGVPSSNATIRKGT